MKIKGELLRRVLDKYGTTNEVFARDMGVDICEVEKLLNGESVGVDTAKKFIAELGADEAQRLIDWDALGKKNPLACEADKLRRR